MGNTSSSSHSKHRQQQQYSNNSSRLSSSSERYATSGPPSAPGKPYLKVASPADEPDVITVKWKPPVYDGDTKITGYIVEHRRTISPHWVKATPGKVQQNYLMLSGLEPGWRYQFRVKAGNGSGYSPYSTVSDPVTITVHRAAVVAPIFVQGIEDRVALENDQVKFEVEFEGTPTPKISWYKDGFELFSNRRQRVNTDNGISTLHIHQTEYTDEGEIKCSATNKAGHAITKARLRLEAPPMVRLPQDYEDGLLLEQNEPMRLKVSVSGRPLPQVTWLHDGEEIRGGDRFEVIHTDKYAALKLPCVKRSDRGCYQIQAVNPLGEHMASFLVTVTDRPSPPGKVHVSKTSGKSVTLSWKPPEDDGGCKIGSYIIEYNRVGWDMWLKASTSRQLMADLDDLLEGSEYRFRVKAENPYGISLPGEVSESIFLPDIKRGIYKPVNSTTSLLSEDEEKLVKIQETEMLEYFGRKSKSPEPCSKPRKLSVDEVSPPVPKRRKKKTKIDMNNSETDIYRSLSFLDVSSEAWQQPIEQKDHWGLPPGLKMTNGKISPEDLTNSQKTSLDLKTKGNSTNSLLLLNFERGSAPPISLSSPELGAESEGFEEHIRNSYSSSELLYERNLNRFNGYSNDEILSSEAQKIAIYAMDRKNSLRKSPITRRSIDDSEEKSVFSDSDSIHSVIDVSKRTNASSFMSLATSIEEEIDNDIEDKTDENDVQSIPLAVMEPENSKESDYEEYVSDDSDKEYSNFGSGKRALEHNTSSAFFSTVYYDDDYLSDQRLSDRERSTSPGKERWKSPGREQSNSPGKERLKSPTKEQSNSPRKERSKSPDNEQPKSPAKELENSDAISQDSLNTGSVGSSDCSQWSSGHNDVEETLPTNLRGRVQSVESKTKNAEICAVVEPADRYRPRDGIPKYVMLPNPFFRERAGADNSNSVKFELSSDSDEIVPPEIPRREDNDGHNYHLAAVPVITVTEMSGEHSDPVSLLKRIFVPSFDGQNEPNYKKYNNVSSGTFNALKRSPERDSAKDAGDGDEDSSSRQREDAEMVVVKHYGDIVERYSGAGKKSSGKTYLDFDQLKMAAAVEDTDPVVEDRYEYESGPEDEEECLEEEDRDTYPTTDDGPRPGTYDPTTSDCQQLAVMESPEPVAIPYLNIFGNLSLAVFGYWLYACKDERLSVPVFGFLLIRFFKTQIWDRI